MLKFARRFPHLTHGPRSRAGQVTPAQNLMSAQPIICGAQPSQPSERPCSHFANREARKCESSGNKSAPSVTKGITWPTSRPQPLLVWPSRCDAPSGTTVFAHRGASVTGSYRIARAFLPTYEHRRASGGIDRGAERLWVAWCFSTFLFDVVQAWRYAFLPGLTLWQTAKVPHCPRRPFRRAA